MELWVCSEGGYYACYVMSRKHYQSSDSRRTIHDMKKALQKPRGVLDHQIVRIPTVYSGRISLILVRAASLSLNHSTLISVYGFHSSGTSSSVKIASTGHSGSQAPQSMHSSGSM